MKPTTQQLTEWEKDTEAASRPALIAECLRLRGILRCLHGSAISAEDGGDFTMGVAEDLTREIRSWGDEAMTAQEYMAAQRVADEQAADEAEFERLRKKLGK